MCAIERGHTNPTWGTVTDIAGTLGISLADLGKTEESIATEVR